MTKWYQNTRLLWEEFPQMLFAPFTANEKALNTNAARNYTMAMVNWTNEYCGTSIPSSYEFFCHMRSDWKVLGRA